MLTHTWLKYISRCSVACNRADSNLASTKMNQQTLAPGEKLWWRIVDSRLILCRLLVDLSQQTYAKVAAYYELPAAARICLSLDT